VVIEIGGGERLAWNQVADSREELDGLRYIAYIDFEPAELDEVSCSSDAGPDGFECVTPLPDMEPGQHHLQVAAYTERDGMRLEGSRSDSIFVRLGSSERNQAMSAQSALSSGTVGARPSLVTAIASGLEDPTDLAALPDGSLLVAERAGRIRLIRGDTLLEAAVVTIDDLITGGGRGLLSMVVDRAFQQTGDVFVLFSTPSGAALARVSVAGGSSGARAVLLDGLPVSQVHPSALVRMGPDGKLYVALDSQGNPRNVGDLGSYSGKVLRLNEDGTTPDDQPAHSPVYRAGLDQPSGMAWSGEMARLWLAGRDNLSRDRLDSIPTDPRMPEALRFALPAGMAPSAVVSYDHPAHPDMRGDLLIGSQATGGLLRIDFDGGAIVGTEWLFRDEPILSMTVAADGTIYALGSTSVFRIVPP
jgi:glucose/arabinose dehydrogenase